MSTELLDARPERAFERRVQETLDLIYRDFGWGVDRSRECRAFDVVIERNGTKERVEEKIRNWTYERAILVEVLQDVETQSPGWLTECEADYIHYVQCQHETPHTIWRLPWPRFQTYAFMVMKTQRPRLLWCVTGHGLTINALIPILPGVEHGVEEIRV